MMEHFAESRALQAEAKTILAHAAEAGWCCYPTMENMIEQRKNSRRDYHREFARKRRAQWKANGLTTMGTPRIRNWTRWNFGTEEERLKQRRDWNRDRMREKRAVNKRNNK